jgi:signal transduction histidine kinase
MFRTRRTPTAALLLGLFITLAAVVADGWYISRQISGLRALQTGLVDRNRRDSLQLLRIQNDLNSIGLAMRDMLDSDEPYPLTAWSAQFARLREDLDDAVAQEAALAVASRTAEQGEYLRQSMAQFWDAADRIFALAGQGHDADARAQIRLSLQARQSALSTAVARLLVQNNEAEEEAAEQVRGIYDRVQRQVYWFVGATLTAILLTSLALIRSNRRLFARLASLSDERQELARQLITAREATLREISRELHDDLGQVLTAMGLMLDRAARGLPEAAPARTELREVQEIAQTTIDKVRSLSQTLHPSALEDAGLEDTMEWYLSTVERQTGITIVYEHGGASRPIPDTVAIHVYRVLQEALSNVARHSGADRARVRLQFEPASLRLEVEDHGRGFDSAVSRRGLGLVGMRERAALIGGSLELRNAGEQGTLVVLTVPLPAADVERGDSSAA